MTQQTYAYSLNPASLDEEFRSMSEIIQATPSDILAIKRAISLWEKTDEGVLDLSGTKFNDHDVLNLAKLMIEVKTEQLRKLTSIDLSNNEITNHGANLLVNLLIHSCNGLIELNLSHNRIGRKGMKELIEFYIEESGRPKAQINDFLKLDDNMLDKEDVQSLIDDIYREHRQEQAERQDEGQFYEHMIFDLNRMYRANLI